MLMFGWHLTSSSVDAAAPARYQCAKDD